MCLCRLSKCLKFYTNRIQGEQNLRQKLRKFCQHLNYDKMAYLIKYTLTVQFSIQDYTRQLNNTNLLNMESKNKLLPPFYPKKIHEIWTKKSINDKTPYFQSNKFTPTLLVILATFRRSVCLSHHPNIVSVIFLW